MVNRIPKIVGPGRQVSQNAKKASAPDAKASSEPRVPVSVARSPEIGAAFGLPKVLTSIVDSYDHWEPDAQTLQATNTAAVDRALAQGIRVLLRAPCVFEYADVASRDGNIVTINIDGDPISKLGALAIVQGNEVMLDLRDENIRLRAVPLPRKPQGS